MSDESRLDRDRCTNRHSLLSLTCLVTETLKIVTYPHPTLRHKSQPIKRVDADLKDMVRQMFDLMYEAKGIGLAANQVDLPIRLFVVNLEAEKGKGEEMVFINPVVSKPKGSAPREEGCLSIPGVYGEVVRPEKVHLNCYNLAGQEFSGEIDGLLARVVQHELDHLDGVMFTDRLSETGKMKVADEVDEFVTYFESKRETGEIPSDTAIRERLAEIEKRYC